MMGLPLSSEARALRAQNARIEKEIKQDKFQDLAIFKMLLLGAGECGKSTILKQIQIVHAGGFSEEDRKQKRALMYENVLNAICLLVKAMTSYGYDYTYPENKENAEMIGKIKPTEMVVEDLSAELVAAIKRLWEDPQIKQCFDRRAEFQLVDSAQYFLDELDRIGAPDFIPNEQDVLMLRVPTTGINEVKVDVGTSKYRIFDVGGQRSERRKWLHCFDNVHAVIFVIAVSEFNQTMMEDSKTNRLQDALSLYGTLLNNEFFTKTSFIVFLNKRDLLDIKLQRGLAFQICFPEYRGENEYKAVIDFVHTRLRAANNRPNDREVYMHETCATDTGQTQAILDSVFRLVCRGNVKNLGLS